MTTNVHTLRGFTWVDVVAPTSEELQKLTEEYSLHPSVVQDCLDPKHLPKYEKIDDTQFIIIRVFDPKAPITAATVRDLTRKVAIFTRENVLLTIHRIELPFLTKVSFQEKRKNRNTDPVSVLLFDILKEGVLTYEPPLQDIEDKIEKLACSPSANETHKKKLQQLHAIRNRLSTFKRLFWHTSTSLQRMPTPVGEVKILMHDVMETVEGLLFFSDELLEETTSLTSLEISMAAERTNQVIRVLTIFSVFFMPLTFIVGIYGMNFENIPEFHWRYGYLFVWFLMIAVTLCTAVWFRRKRWL